MHNIHEKYGNAKAGFIKVLRSDNKHVGNKIRQLTPFFNLAPPIQSFCMAPPQWSFQHLFCGRTVYAFALLATNSITLPLPIHNVLGVWNLEK